MVVNTTPPEGRVRTLLQILPAIGLLRGLTEQVATHGESAEELVIKVIAVGEEDDGRVLHGRMSDDLSGIEGHEQALAGALSVPDDADAAVALGAGGGDRALDRVAHGVELVIPGQDLDDARARVLEHDEVVDQGQNSGLFENALNDRFRARGHPWARRRTRPRCARA